MGMKDASDLMTAEHSRKLPSACTDHLSLLNDEILPPTHRNAAFQTMLIAEGAKCVSISLPESESIAN